MLNSLPPADADRRGMVLGLSAYLWWGLSPLFWKQLDDLAAIDILGWRVVWAFALVSLLVAATRRDVLRPRLLVPAGYRPVLLPSQP